MSSLPGSGKDPVKSTQSQSHQKSPCQKGCPKSMQDQSDQTIYSLRKKSEIVLRDLKEQTRKATAQEQEVFSAFSTNKDFTSMPIASHVHQGRLALPERNKIYVTENVLKGTQCAGATRKRLADLGQGWYSIAMLVEVKDSTLSVQNEIKRVDFYRLIDKRFVPHPKHIYYETEILRTVSLKRKSEVSVDASCQTTWTISPLEKVYASSSEHCSAQTSEDHQPLFSSSHSPSKLQKTSKHSGLP